MKVNMENMLYAEELVREFLLFRGFTTSLQAFEKELSTDIGKNFEVDKILDLIFSIYVPKFQAQNLVNLLSFIQQCFSSSEASLLSELSKLDVSILRYYIIYAIQSRRTDKVMEFFDVYGNDLLQKDQDWSLWFAIPYLKNPQLDPHFRVYFSKDWFNTLHLSFRNFLSGMFNGNRLPALLKISSERNSVNRLKKDVKQLNVKLSELQALLEEKEAQLRQLRRASLMTEVGVEAAGSSSHSEAVGTTNEITYASGVPHELHVSVTTDLNKRDCSEDQDGGPSEALDPCPRVNSHPDQNGISRNFQISPGDFGSEVDGEIQKDEEFPEVKVEFQETFLGHTSPISRCRFSASGDNIASASVDGTVRIWTYDSSVPASRNATIYCGAEVLSLEWECKSDRLLLIGTADGGIKAWNVDAKRVVCDLNSNKAYPSILDIKCSPVEPIFVSASASTRHGTNAIDSLGFASLTVWNMRTWKPMTVLSLGKDPPAITSLCFNHNGKLLAAGATDGMIHMFDMSAGLQITGWPAHDSGISSVLFGPDETSIFSLGTDGKIFEWSLHNQGKVLWSRNASRFCSIENSLYRHEMALDANGKRLLMTSDSVRAPIYQVRGRTSGMKTLPHSSSITTVDWHPTLPLFLTGSADHSVRVTSIS